MQTPPKTAQKSLRRLSPSPGYWGIKPPADIIAIIEPPKPEMDKAVYLSLKKKGNLSLWEQDYITEFERGSVAAWRSGNDR